MNINFCPVISNRNYISRLPHNNNKVNLNFGSDCVVLSKEAQNARQLWKGKQSAIEACRAILSNDGTENMLELINSKGDKVYSYIEITPKRPRSIETEKQAKTYEIAVQEIVTNAENEKQNDSLYLFTTEKNPNNPKYSFEEIANFLKEHKSIASCTVVTNNSIEEIVSV